MGLFKLISCEVISKQLSLHAFFILYFRRLRIHGAEWHANPKRKNSVRVVDITLDITKLPGTNSISRYL